MQYIGALGILLFSTMANAQIKEEKLILKRKRVPEVKKIEKKKTSVDVIKDYPKEEKSKNPVRYQITDVPVSSDFQTSIIMGEDVSPVLEQHHQNNYIRLGAGNYGKILGDAYATYSINKKNEIGLDAHYLSTSGLKKDYDWKSNQMRFGVAGFVNHYAKTGKVNLTAKYQDNKYQYYGIYARDIQPRGDLQQNFNVFGAEVSYDHYSNEILNDIYLKTNFLKDHFKANETNINFGVNLSKPKLSFNNFVFDSDLSLDLQTVNTNFDIESKNTNAYLKLNVAPLFSFKKNEWNVKLGSDFTFLNHQFSNANINENKSTRLYWFPKVEVEFAKNEYFKVFGGVDGNLNLNTYQGLLNENPYVLSNQILKPTNTKYHLYGGLRGDWEETFKYEISANFSQIEDISFFKANSPVDYITNQVGGDEVAAYDLGNSFSVAYDDAKLFQLKGAMTYFPMENLAIEGDLSINQYTLKNYNKILNKPFIESGIGAKYRLLSSKLLLGTKAFFAFDRTTNAFYYTNTIQENAYENLGNYIDFNLSAEYNIYKNFSIFAIGNNLLNRKYQIYRGCKVLGAQILGGLKYTF